MQRKLLSSIRSGLAAGILLGALAVPATHALAAEDDVGLEEIVVTAQKREQNLQDVGISVAALGGDTLEQLGVSSTMDIVQHIAGLQLTTFTPAFVSFNLRGVSQNNFQDNLEAPVAVYMDEAYVASMNAIGGQVFDIKRVEVLRGPQGTLFGRNATGGLIHYITQGADDTALNGYAEGSYSEYNKMSLEGAVGGSLSDSVRARIAGRYEKADGYVESTTPGVRDAHGANGYTVRGSLQVDFTDRVQGDLRLSYSKDDDVPSGAYTVFPASADPVTGLGIALAPPQDVWGHNSNYEGRLDRDVTGVTGKLSFDLGNDMELVSITNYLTMDKFYTEDGDGDVVNFPYTTTAEFDQFSEELRLSGNTDRTRWQVGAYFLDMSLDMGQVVEGEIILPLPESRVDTFARIDSRNWSLFGQMEFDLTDTLTLIAGARYSDDQKDADMQIVIANFPGDPGPTQVFDLKTDPAFVGLDKIDYGDWAARLQLDWRVSEDILAYLSYNRGIKGGNWSIAPGGGVDPAVFRHDAETLNSYELGLKSSFANGRAQLNAGVFYYDYEDYQAFSLTNLIPQVANSDATAKGGEIELQLAPTESWYFSVGAAFLDSKVDAVPDVFGGTVEAEFPNAPSLSVNALGRYTWTVPVGKLSVQLDGVANAKQYLEGTNSQVSREPAYSVWNARLALAGSDDRWEVAAWMKNFTNEEYRLYSLDLGLAGFAETVYAPPRWAGITARIRW
jgi:iron complex outermembrane receptor protein